MPDKRQQLSMLDQCASSSGKVSRSTERLSEIDGFINWVPLYAVGRRTGKTGSQGGQPRKSVRWMIRGFFLQHLYQLRDLQLADQLIDRLSFRRFAGLPVAQQVTDFTIFWRRHEALAEAGLIEELFVQITRQLENKELILKREMVTDAAIMESAARPLSENKRVELETNSFPQIDTDADSTKKGGQFYFGYRDQIGLDMSSKLIRTLCFTKASPYDLNQLEKLLAGDERAIFGDKACPPKDLKIRCRSEGIYYGILDKAYWNNPLSRSQKACNARHRWVRCYVEHSFSVIKYRYGMRLARAKTKLCNKVRFVMSAICWNIERGIRWAKNQPNPVPAGAG